MKIYNFFNHHVFSDFVEQILYDGTPFEASSLNGNLIVKVDIADFPETAEWLKQWDSKTLETEECR